LCPSRRALERGGGAGLAATTRADRAATLRAPRRRPHLPGAGRRNQAGGGRAPGADEATVRPPAFARRGTPYHGCVRGPQHHYHWTRSQNAKSPQGVTQNLLLPNPPEIFFQKIF